MQVRNYCPTEGQANDKYRLVDFAFVGSGIAGSVTADQINNAGWIGVETSDVCKQKQHKTL